MSSIATIAFAIRVLLFSPALDDGIDPILMPTITEDSPLEIDPITPQEIDVIYLRWGIQKGWQVKREKLLGYASIRLRFSKTPARFVNLLGNVESGIADDLLVLLTENDHSVGIRFARVQRMRYKLIQ